MPGRTTLVTIRRRSRREISKSRPRSWTFRAQVHLQEPRELTPTFALPQPDATAGAILEVALHSPAGIEAARMMRKHDGGVSERAPGDDRTWRVIATVGSY